jgi:hypothetical protein
LGDVPESNVGRGAGFHLRIQQRLIARALRLQDKSAGIDQRLENLIQSCFFLTRPLIQHRDRIT